MTTTGSQRRLERARTKIDAAIRLHALEHDLLREAAELEQDGQPHARGLAPEYGRIRQADTAYQETVTAFTRLISRQLTPEEDQ
ncbi:hypothetical protein CSQ85_09305 [Bifidobacterium rousetti]|uniref:hypothetical protein n=1 Tax=Bifidobacterium rousetti TaxID=2045439 RepID=UPI00123B9C48|nr:hypothetical protein [Bifidobacterium rousetti]KAA8818348.1 hypothetical protein CSQ85_09305 [Bifidobacterium rousetti]